MSSTIIIIPIIIVVVIVVSLILLTRNSDSSPLPPPPSSVFTLDLVRVEPKVGLLLPPSESVSDAGRTFGVSLPFNSPVLTFTFSSDTLKLKKTLVLEYTLADPNNVFINITNDNMIFASLLVNVGITIIASSISRTQTTTTSKVYNMKHVFSLGEVEPTLNKFVALISFTKSNTGTGKVTNNLSKVEMYDM